MSDKSLDYSGKPNEISRKIGMNPGTIGEENRTRVTGDQRATLINTLDLIIRISNSLIEEAEETLSKVAVIVPEASITKEAFAKEWPKEFGDITDKMTFAQFKVLEKKNTSAAVILRTYYQKHIRLSDSSSLFDIYKVIILINQEAKRMKAFIMRFLKLTSGKEKGPAFRLFQDWANEAIIDLNNLWNYVLTKPIESVSIIEGKNVQNITNADAKSFQATVQGKVNAVNAALSMNLSGLDKSHGDLADKFYNEFLGPAMSFREDVSERLENTRSHANTSFSNEIDNDTIVYNTNLKLVLADQLTRTNLYKEKIAAIQNLIEGRDRYLAQINLLSSVGSVVIPQVVEYEPSKDEISFYKSYRGTDEDIFKASHNYLDDLDDPQAHPQYLLKGGDVITGDISIVDGVRVDGVDISSHVHNGEDGSKKIDARDLVEGSLEVASINPHEKVQRPENLEYVSESIRLSAATTLVDVTLRWRGDPSNKFEFQIAPVRTHVGPAVEKVFDLIKGAPGSDAPETGWESLWTRYHTDDGSNWWYLLSPDADSNGKGDFNSRGMGAGALGNRIILNKAQDTDETPISESSLFADYDFTTDMNFPYPHNVSTLWIRRQNSSFIIAAGNKLYEVDWTSSVNTLETFSESSMIYSLSVEKKTGVCYFFVKHSDYSDDPLKSSNTSIELWKLEQGNHLTKIYTWTNQQAIDHALDLPETPHGWFTDAINEKDYSLINTGTIVGDYIYSFCLFNLDDSDFYSVPDLVNNTLPVLCRFSLVTKQKEIVRAHDGSYIICFGDNKFMSPQPVFKGDVIYMPGNVVSSNETISNTATINSVVRLENTVFSRQYITNPNHQKVHYRNIISGNADIIYQGGDDIVFALGMFEDSSIDVGEMMGAIYDLGDL